MDCMRESIGEGIVLDGRYQTLSPLNHGSFGMVFLARDLTTNETVAVKCLTKKSAASEAGLDFAVDDKSEELVLHSQLSNHPNIVNLIEAFETDAHIYLVLEFCPRGDLYEAIRRGHGPLETEHVRSFMLELVDAVDYIHSKGIYHRDIKPENIFLTQAGSMKLGDFGLATTEQWTFESTVGSDRYMSPEQYDSAGAGYSPAQADIWAIGICLLNILFSRNPFTTPTEADPLFLDFSRDKQSLFDVFPSMSQDTYEVIVQCMNMDPSKRSLDGAREALERVVSFTTLDEALDDFCSSDRKTVPTANREPLRTPSIQSPHLDQGAFPWAKVLHTSPKPIRQLSAIPDNESYTEDLFSKSQETTADWCSGTAQTPSISSVLDSSLGASMQSLYIGRPSKMLGQALPRVSPMAGSLPITMTKPRSIASMSMVFGKKDTVSKSWSDMWDEDEEEEENERIQQLQALKRLNSRTWSQESKTDEETPRQGLSPQTKTLATVDDVLPHDIDGDLVADGFFFHDAPSPKQHRGSPSRYSPPSKQGNMDKWAALGERRRAHTGGKSGSGRMTSDSNLRTGRQTAGNVFGISSGNGDWDHTNNHQIINNTHHFTNNKWNNITRDRDHKDRAKECPWNKGREWAFMNWRKEKRPILDDIEWVGGWQEAQS